MERNKTRKIVLMAFYIALFMVLDYLTTALPLLKMPQGGSIGLGTVALLMASYHLGWKDGLVVAILSVFMQFITGPMYTPDLVGFTMDYLLAFGIYGIASIFPNISYFYSGIVVTNVIRYLLHVVSGVIVWGVDWWGSFVYNFYYMLATMILGIVLVPILMKALKPMMKE